VTDANGHQTQFAYNSRNSQISETDALGGITQYGYDLAGNRTTVTDPKPATWTYQFNAHNRQKKLTQPDGRIEQLFYDPNGNPVKKIDGNGATILYEHDALNRLTKRDHPTGTDVTFTYDATGRRLTMTDATGTTTYSYDALGRPLSVAAPIAGGKTVSYTWDAVGRRATMTDPDAGVTSYQYDSANRLTSLTNPFNETTGFVYDALGRLTRQNNANGTYSTWTFDAAGQASQVQTRKSDETIVLSMAYTRDNVGNPTSVSEALLDTDDQTTHNATLTYTYDDLHRLTSEKRSSAGQTPTSQPIWYEYTMDAAGNRTQFVEKDQQGQVVGTTSATYSDDNRLLTYGNLDYAWDDNGNLTSKTVNPVETTYGWDYENKLTSLTDGSTLSFTYNGDGLRQSRTVDRTTTRFVYSGMRLLQETNSGGTTQAAYTLAPMGGQWEPLLSHRKSGASRFYAFDVLGTTRALTDGSEDVAAVFTDDAWGNVLNASDSSATAHQYVGRYGYYLDGASGLQLLTQRYYDGGVGRFVSEDPRRHRPNWSIYASARPATLSDPNGLRPMGPGDPGHDPDPPGPWPPEPLDPPVPPPPGEPQLPGTPFEPYPRPPAPGTERLRVCENPVTLPSPYPGFPPVTDMPPNIVASDACDMDCLRAHEECHRRQQRYMRCCRIDYGLRLILSGGRAIRTDECECYIQHVECLLWHWNQGHCASEGTGVQDQPWTNINYYFDMMHEYCDPLFAPPPPPPPPPSSCQGDADCDGIPDSSDPSPLHPGI